MTTSSEDIRRLRSIKATYETELMRRANVVGVGIGMRMRNGQPTDEPAIVVSVTHKVPTSLLRAQDVIPAELDGFPVDVQATGSLTALVERARQVKQVHAGQLLRKRNVVGVGLGYKMVGGMLTGEVGLIVSVVEKVASSVLAAEDMVPKTVDGVPTDVCETGVLRALDLGPRDRWRPVMVGSVSIGHYGGATGTFGCLVQRDGERFMLSNNHVLADQNQGRVGDAILQPGPADGGNMDDHVAMLADYAPIDFGASPAECPVAQWTAKALNALAGVVGSSHRLQAIKKTEGWNVVDAALARPLDPDSISSEILYIGQPRGVGSAALGSAIQKAGRTTGLTHGTVTQIEATMRIDYRGRSALFSGQYVTDAASQPGDSGSAVLDMEKRVVGLLFAGSDTVTIVNPIEDVLSALNIELAL